MTSTFLQIALNFQHQGQNYETSTWQDTSTPTHFSFTSSFGNLKLLKRFDYPCTYAYIKGSVLYFGYGQSELPNLLTIELQDIPESTFYRDEFLIGVIDCQEQTIIIQRDAFGTLPLFAGHTKERIAISNTYQYVYEAFSPTTFHSDIRRVLDFLEGNNFYERTLLQEIFTIYDRMRLTWSSTQLHLEKAPAGQLARIERYTMQDASAFRRNLEQALHKRLRRYKTTPLALELSGGLDSSCLAAYLMHARMPFTAATLIYPGTMGSRQRHKIQQLSATLHIESNIFPILAEDYVLSDKLAGDTFQPFYAFDEPYSASFGKIIAYLAAANITTVVRGIGGDELCENMPNYADKPETPLISYSTITALFSSNNMYLNSGIWPVTPFATPELLLYTQRLAPQYRYNKAILRAYCKLRGLPESIHSPVFTESFAGILEASLHRLAPRLEALLERSILLKAGIISRSDIHQAWKSLDQPPSEYDRAFWLYKVLVIENTLQNAGITRVS